MVSGMLKVIRIAYIAIYSYIKYNIYLDDIDTIYYSGFWNGYSLRRWNNGKEKRKERK